MWQAISIVEVFQDMAGKWYSRVLITDGTNEETMFVKSQEEPVEADSIAAAQRICDQRNAAVQEE